MRGSCKGCYARCLVVTKRQAEFGAVGFGEPLQCFIDAIASPVAAWRLTGSNCHYDQGGLD